MTPEHGFLDSIWEDLDDDATKLIFSDWLDERDDWRAEILRWQVERNRHGFWTRPYKQLHTQIISLLYERGKDWVTPLSRYTVRYSDGTGLLWLRMPPSAFAKLAEPRTSEGVHRWVTEVSLDGGKIASVLTALDRGPDVRIFLNFSRTSSNDIGTSLVSSPNLRRVRSLDFTFSNLHARDLRTLLHSSALSPLQYLFFGFSDGVSEVPNLLAEANQLTNLRGLDLAQCGLKDADLEKLARAPALGGLTALYLERNRFGVRGVSALVESRVLKNLRVLDLRSCGLKETDVAGKLVREHFPFATI